MAERVRVTRSTWTVGCVLAVAWVAACEPPAPAPPAQADADTVAPAPLTNSGAAALLVFPFEPTASDDEEALSFAAGIHSDLTSRLRRAGAFRVVADVGSGFPLANSTVAEAAEAYAADLALLGTVDRRGDSVFVEVELVDGITESTVWRDRYGVAAEMGTITNLLATVAQRVASALQTDLTPSVFAGFGK